MSLHGDFEFVKDRAGGYPETTPLAYEKRIIQAGTAVGEAFRGFMCEQAAEEAGIPEFLDFSGELTLDTSTLVDDMITERLMGHIAKNQSPVAYGSMLAISGLGLIRASNWGMHGYAPTLIDHEITLFGRLIGAGVAEYEYVPADEIKSAGYEQKIETEVTKGVVALLRNLEVRGSDYGIERPVVLVQAVVPFSAEGLTLHKIDERDMPAPAAL